MPHSALLCLHTCRLREGALELSNSALSGGEVGGPLGVMLPKGDTLYARFEKSSAPQAPSPPQATLSTLKAPPSTPIRHLGGGLLEGVVFLVVARLLVVAAARRHAEKPQRSLVIYLQRRSVLQGRLRQDPTTVLTNCLRNTTKLLVCLHAARMDGADPRNATSATQY